MQVPSSVSIRAYDILSGLLKNLDLLGTFLFGSTVMKGSFLITLWVLIEKVSSFRSFFFFVKIDCYS